MALSREGKLDDLHSLGLFSLFRRRLQVAFPHYKWLSGKENHSGEVAESVFASAIHSVT
jgi:hypothetical protein